RTAAARTSAKAPRKTAAAKPAPSTADKERPLVEDIRLLGRLLGEVIREQEGLAAFELIERVRQLSVAYRIHKDASAGRVLERLHEADHRATEIAAALNKAFISPVLTAHPTEVQRKSILDAERAIAELLAERSDLFTERALDENTALMRARITQLWQTRML